MFGFVGWEFNAYEVGIVVGDPDVDHVFGSHGSLFVFGKFGKAEEG